MSIPENRRVSFAEAKKAAIDVWEYRFLIDLMRETNGNVSRAARLARCDRNHLRGLLVKHGLTNKTAPFLWPEKAAQ